VLKARIAPLIAAGICAVLTGGAAPAAASVCLVPGLGQPLDQVWHPDMQAALGYSSTRTGDIAFAVRTDQNFYGYRPDHVEWSASVVKAMLMVAYLDQSSVAGRPLNGYDTSLLEPMITQSDNNAATQVRNIVGNSGLQGLANRVGMTNFATNPTWGLTSITARDQTLFFLHIDSFIPPRHRAYALHLLASVTPSQRWGIGEVPPAGWQLYFKGGWGSGTGAVDHQVALLVRGCARVAVAVLTLNDGTHDYGKETLREIFRRLLQGLPSGATIGGWTQPRTISSAVNGREFAHYAGTGTGEALMIQSMRRADDTLATVPIDGIASGTPRRVIGPLSGSTIEAVAFGDGTRAVAVGITLGAHPRVQSRSRFARHRAFRFPESLSTRSARPRDPVVAMNGAGATVIAWIAHGSRGGSAVQAAVRPAGAPRFRPAQTLSTPTPGITKPAVAISSDGVTTVAWSDVSGVRAATSAGGSFSKPVLLGPARLARGLSPTGELALASEGRDRILAAWGARDRTRSGRITVRILEAQGSVRRGIRSFRLAGQPSDVANYGPAVAVTSHGTAVIAFSFDRGVTVASGRVRTRPRLIQTIIGVPHGAPGDLVLGTNNAGGVVLAWAERVSGCCGVVRVAVRRAGWRAFGTAATLSSPGELAVNPAVAISSAGKGTTVWLRGLRRSVEASLSG
jgi:beta-lactamase family protein